jgi:hypothetical protein
VVPDETKLAIANRATRGSARLKTIGARKHRSLLLVLSLLFAIGTPQTCRLQCGLPSTKTKGTTKSSVDQKLPHVGAVEIHLGHAQPPARRTGNKEPSMSQISSTGPADDRSGDTVKIRQRALIPCNRCAGAFAARGLGRKSANPRLSMAASLPNLARGDARIIDGGICFSRLGVPRQSRRGRRRPPVQYVAIRMIKFECPWLLYCSLGGRRFRSQSRKSHCHRGNFVPDHIASPCTLLARYMEVLQMQFRIDRTMVSPIL